jgi:thiamine-monophosphate kinase
MAEASGCALELALDAVPLSAAFVAERGESRQARLFAATGGDDYALLAAMPPDCDLETLSLPAGTRITRIGTVRIGEPGILLTFGGEPVALPERLGFEHSGGQHRGFSASPVGDRP